MNKPQPNDPKEPKKPEIQPDEDPGFTPAKSPEILPTPDTEFDHSSHPPEITPLNVPEAPPPQSPPEFP